MSRTISVIERLTISQETGEVTTDFEFLTQSFTHYIRVHPAILANLRNINSSALVFFFTVLIPLTMKDNDLFLTGKVIRDISKATGMSQSRVRQLVDDCWSNWLIIKLGQGTYKVNPHIGFKGSQKDRHLLLKNIFSGDIKVFVSGREDNFSKIKINQK